MKKTFKKMLSVFCMLVMVMTSIPATGITVQAAEQTVYTSETTEVSDKYLADNIQDGAILHCWCWSFDAIKENMADIAAAGFTTIQTSPANECNDSYPSMKLMGSSSDGTDGAWWWHYQPTDWTIGNYQLGTEEDFAAMCEEADKYGVKVIVDVIPNHTATDTDKVSKNLYNAVGGYDNLYHANGFTPITDYSDRLQCTTGEMNGLHDVDTENPDFQVYFLNYLNDLIECGADGFRYDTAKHIGVPSDPLDSKSESKGYTTNFWPVVTGEESVNGVSLMNADEIFNYGEVLQDTGVPETEYAEYINMTGSSFGYVLRDAVKNKNFYTSTMLNMLHSTPERLVTWVESHDTYCNDGESVSLTDTQIRLAWAVIAARKDGTPLFFSRPDGSDGWSNRWGNNVIGAKGNDEFMSTEVAEVNFFRNAMAGESEYMRNPNGNTQILQIDRGTIGTCIINLGSATTLTNVATSMEDGTYTDQVSGRTFTVSNGKLSGTLDAEKVAVIYNPTAEKLTASTEDGSTEFGTDTVDITLAVRNISNATYTTSEGASGSFANGDVITIGSKTEKGENITVTLTGEGADGEVVKEFVFYKADIDIAYLVLPSGWSTPYCYVYNTSGDTNGSWPGVLMEHVSGDLYKYEVPSDIENPLVIFYGGSDENRYPYDGETGLSLSDAMVYENGVWKTYSTDWKEKVDGSYDVYIYKPSGWGSTLYCYAYTSAGASNASWPGVKMVNLGGGVYAYNLPDSFSSAYLIFSDGTNQYPAAMATGLSWTNGTSRAYAYGEWLKVETTVAVTGVTLDQEALELTVDDTATLKATVTPTNATDSTVTWSSSDESVATVDANGVVTAISAGTAVISATAGEKTASCTVTVKKQILISKAALQLENDITIIFKAAVSLVDDNDYKDCYVEVVQEKENGETEKQTIQGVLSSDGQYYEFKYTGVNAKEVGDALDVTIYAYNEDGKLVTGKTLENYSAMKYCTSQLSKTDEYFTAIGMSEAQQAAFRALLVDLVNYASAAQTYFGYKTDALVSDQLTEAQKAYASSDNVLDSLESITNASYVKIENPTAAWKSAGLNLLSKTTVRLQFEYAGDISKVTMAAKVNGKEVDAVTEFESLGNNLYYVYFDGMTACQFSVPLDFTIMENGTAISNTLRYSVESYVVGCKDNANVGAVMSAMMKYGKAAVSYKTAE